MSARRALLLCLAALFSAVLITGCATTVSGNGSLAANVQVPGTADDNSGGESTSPSDESSSPHTDPSDDGGSDNSSSDGGDDSAPAGTGKVCRLFTKGELRKLFGGPVTVKVDNDRGCDLETDGNGAIILSVYDFLTMKDEAAREPGGRSLTVAGKPAYQGKREILVARTSDPAAPGLIVASNLFFDDEAKGNFVCLQLLKKLVPAFPK